MVDENFILKVCQSIPILEYTSIVAHQSGTMDFCTTSIKFERDLQELLSNGYQSITLQEYTEIANERKPCPSKAFCVVLVGGYADNYTEAFPILQRLNVKASIFIATELVGLSSHPKAPNMSPHFGWEEAQKMVDSGVLNIYIHCGIHLIMGKILRPRPRRKLNFCKRVFLGMVRSSLLPIIPVI